MKRPMHKDDANRRRVYVGHGGGGRIWNFDSRYSSQRPLFRGRVCLISTGMQEKRCHKKGYHLVI